MNLVIGSGPAGVSLAMALIARGQSVTLLDGGQTLSPGLVDKRDALAARSPEDWDRKEIADWQAPQLTNSSDLAMRYGSTHAQNPADQLLDPADTFSGRSSLAVGGLSKVWGAAVLPYRQSDIEDWPIDASALAPHYQAVSGFMPIAGKIDGLQDLFPAFDADALSPLAVGPQGATLLERLSQNRARLEASGVHFGAARQAVRADCKLCGQCLHGCPWSMIYAADQTLRDLQKSERFTYHPGAIVSGVSETDGEAHVHLADGMQLSADRVFVAAGVYETARLILNSADTSDATLTLQDSRQFFLPMLHRWGTNTDPNEMPLHTLAKAFVEIDHADVSPYLTHSQIYSWNAFFAREMMENYGHKLPGSQALFSAIAKRLMVAQTFIHSDHCDSVVLRLNQNTHRLHTHVIENEEMIPTIERAASTLSKAMRRAGLYALGFAKRIEGPGASFHTGGTLPMSKTPKTLQTNPLGLLNGFERIHVVDASVLPSIPASTITFTVMANAHRIGSLV